MKTSKNKITEDLSKIQLVELDACVRCGECLKWCPVYEALKDKTITTPEKIAGYRDMVQSANSLMAILSGEVSLSDEKMKHLAEALYKCTTCGVCGEVCEVGIYSQRLWPKLRERMVKLGYGPMETQKPVEGIVSVKHNPYDKPHEDRLAWLPKDIKITEKAEVGFFVGCSGAYVAQGMVAGAVRVLNKAGIRFTILDDEHCCGFPLNVLGVTNILKDLVRHNVEGYIQRGVKKLVTSCPCCLSMLRNHWERLYGDKLPFEILHTTEIIAENIDKLEFKERFDTSITFHDPCYLSRTFGIIEEPRRIISRMPVIRYIELPRYGRLSKCCGAGGGIRRAFPDVTFDMALSLVKDAEKIGAEVLLLDCPACYERIPLSIKMKEYNTRLRIMDLMELVAMLV